MDEIEQQSRTAQRIASRAQAIARGAAREILKGDKEAGRVLDSALTDVEVLFEAVSWMAAKAKRMPPSDARDRLIMAELDVRDCMIALRFFDFEWFCMVAGGEIDGRHGGLRR